MEMNISMAKNDLVSVIHKARKVYRETFNKIEAIKVIRMARPDVGVKGAKDFWDWIDANGDGLSAPKLAGHWCEEHWQDNEICRCPSVGRDNPCSIGSSGQGENHARSGSVLAVTQTSSRAAECIGVSPGEQRPLPVRAEAMHGRVPCELVGTHKKVRLDASGRTCVDSCGCQSTGERGAGANRGRAAGIQALL
jgi:hypothetical protein